MPKGRKSLNTIVAITLFAYVYIDHFLEKNCFFLIKYCISYVYSPAIETSQHVSVPLTVTVTLTSYTVCNSVTYCENVVHRQVCTLGIPSVFSH